MKISIIISTFNRSKLLPRAIKSVFKQYFKDWELIVVDDASTDRTEKVVNKLFKKHSHLLSQVQYIKLDKNSGSDTYPKNYGIKVAKGKYVCFLDDDDEYLPDHLQVLYNQIKSDKFDIVYGDRIVISPKGKFIGASRDFYSPLLSQINWIAMCDPIIRKEILFDVGGFDESLPKFVDWNLWIRLAKADYRFHHIPIPISKVYIGSKSSKSLRVKSAVDPQTGGYLPTFFDPSDCKVFANKTCLGEEKKPKVAIFTLTKDRLKYTKKMYETMGKFAGYNFDWFVVDQGSKDGTKEWLKNVPAKIQFLEKNVGISKGSNLALNAIGDNYDIIVKVDNDCFFLSNDWLKTIVEIYRINRQIVCSPYVEGLKENPGGTPRSVPSGKNPYRNISDILLGHVNHLGGLCIAAPSKAYKDFRWQDKDFYSGIQDWIFSQFCRKILQYTLFYIENIRVSHGPSTEQQHKDFKDYFELRKIENTTKYENSDNNASS